jgi:hypothetical protein
VKPSNFLALLTVSCLTLAGLGIALSFGLLSPSLAQQFAALSFDWRQGRIYAASTQAENTTLTRVRSLNKSLLRLSQKKPGILGKYSSSNTKQIEKLAKERKALLKQLARRYPALVKEVVLTPDQIAAMPPEVSSQFESRIEGNGTLETYSIDRFGKSAKATIEQYVSLDSGEGPYQTFFVQAPDQDLTTHRVKVKGITMDNLLLIDNTQSDNLVVESTAQIAAPGEKNVLVVLFNFRNDTRQPFNISAVTNQLISGDRSTQAFLQDTSFQTTSLKIGQTIPANDGDPWITINMDNSPCSSLYYWLKEVNKTLGEQYQVDLGAFDHRIYIFPETNHCYWGGMAEVSGSQVVMNGVNQASSYAHELGHNFGLYDAGSATCGGKWIDATCKYKAYGDSTTTMGSSYYFRQYNGIHKGILGWIPAENIQEVSTPGTYRIWASELNLGGPQVLKIKRPSIVRDNFYAYLYLSYRQAVGFDAWLPRTITSGVQLHTANASPLWTVLLDAHPETTHIDDASMTDNQTLASPLDNIYITQKSHDTQSVEVEISFTSPPPSPSPSPSPLPSPSPSPSPSPEPPPPGTKGCSSDGRNVLEYRFIYSFTVPIQFILDMIPNSFDALAKSWLTAYQQGRIAKTQLYNAFDVHLGDAQMSIARQQTRSWPEWITYTGQWVVIQTCATNRSCHNGVCTAEPPTSR